MGSLAWQVGGAGALAAKGCFPLDEKVGLFREGVRDRGWHRAEGPGGTRVGLRVKAAEDACAGRVRGPGAAAGAAGSGQQAARRRPSSGPRPPALGEPWPFL